MQDFIGKIRDGAVSAQQKYGVLASLTIAQAILETGWGEASVGNNIFGIKAGGAWKGASQTAKTQEWNGNKFVTIVAAFRAYASVAASIEDHAALLAGNCRYKNIIGCTDYKQVCRYIQADGYATDPGYANKLISLIEQYGLHQFDVPAVAPDYCDTIGTLTMCPGMEYQFKSGSKITCANNSLVQIVHTVDNGYHYTKFRAQSLCAGVGLYVNGVRKCIAVVKKPSCDASTLTKRVGQVYQFRSDFPLTCGNGAIWQQQGKAIHQDNDYFTKFKALSKGSAGFYCGSTRVCVGTVI